MNITDLVVERLQQGHKVDLPGIGTLDSVMQSPRHDEATHTYYPATRSIVFNGQVSGEGDLTPTIAERECVGVEVAKQMWRNYIDALGDKLKRSGSHQFGKLGTMSYDGQTYSFAVAEGLILDAGNAGETPITDVKTYAFNANDDPFAQFEEDEPKVTVVSKKEPTPAPEPQPEPQPKPEPQPEPQPEPAPEPEPVAEQPAAAEEQPVVSNQWEESLRKLDELPKSKAALKAEEKAEKERLKAEAKAEKERAKLQKRAAKESEAAERLAAQQREAEERRLAEERRHAEEALRVAEEKAEAERLRTEKLQAEMLQKAELKAEEERIKAEKRAAALAAVAAAQGTASQSAAAESVAASGQEARKSRAEERAEKKLQAAAAAAAEKEAARRMKEERKQAKAALKQQKEGRKSHKGLVITLILLVLLLGGAATYYFVAMAPATKAPAVVAQNQGKHLDVSAVNPLTFNPDMIIYDNREIAHNRDLVCLVMTDYINSFLADRSYSSARVPMMDRVRQYAEERLSTLMGPRFAVQRLIPYNDYIYKAAEPWLKVTYATATRYKVQGELMNEGALDEMLNQLVDELGIAPSDAPRTAPEVQQPAAQEAGKPATVKKKAAAGENPLYVYVEKDSKQGFDIIAGFYLNKSTAAKMTARLHEQGCDAYIIEKNDMFYVSMGSAPTRTKAEALYNHIKSWYDGDIVIKEL